MRFKTTQRQVVQTAGARIGLAETQLACDANGAYRAQQIYHVDNNTEQYLEIAVPLGADLWTTRVAGEPVKPTIVPGSPDRVRIPLVKTEPGDLDYPVVIKYGGTLQPLGRMASVDFPLIRAINVNVELSQARVFLPETHAWFDFGGTMRQVTQAGEFEAGYMSYQTRRVERLAETLRDGSIYAQLRGASNFENLKTEISEFNKSVAPIAANDEFKQSQGTNASALQQAHKQIADNALPDDAVELLDNRVRLRGYWKEQRSGRARNVVQDLADNFRHDRTVVQSADKSADGRFNDAWVAFSLEPAPTAASQGPVTGAVAGRKPPGPGGAAGRGRQSQTGMPQRRKARAPRAPEIAQQVVIDELREERDALSKVDADANELYGGDADGRARRYQQRLQQKGGGGGGGVAATRYSTKRCRREPSAEPPRPDVRVDSPGSRAAARRSRRGSSASMSSCRCAGASIDSRHRAARSRSRRGPRRCSRSPRRSALGSSLSSSRSSSVSDGWPRD